MEEHSTWIAETVNHLLGPLIAPTKTALLTTVYGWLGKPYVPGEQVIPEHIIFAIIVFLGCCIFFPLIRLTFSVEKPGKFQQGLELFVEALGSQMEDIIGHGGKRYLPMVATIGLFVLCKRPIAL